MKTFDKTAYLKNTFFCDSDNREIIKTANIIKGNLIDEKEIAVNVFNFVRDSTIYEVGNWRKKASQTLKKGSGTCTNNANLLVALLRALGIPSGFGVMEVIGPNYFGPIVLHHFNYHVSKKTKHIYAYVYLNNKWVKCDPSDDEPLSNNTQHLNPQSKKVIWNGIDDAVLNISSDHIISDSGPFSNIDHIINKRMKYRRKIPVYFANIYIQFLREEGSKIKNISEIEHYFYNWLFERNILVYFLYKTFFKINYIIKIINHA